MDNKKLYQPIQSAYRKFHSVETTLIKVNNDLQCSLDNKKMSILILLDLLAAFDTIQHNVLLDRMQSRLGIRGSAIEWFRAYLTQAVKVSGSLSEEKLIEFDVPQGSILVLLLFSLCTIRRYSKSSWHEYSLLRRRYPTLPYSRKWCRSWENWKLYCWCEKRMTANFLKLHDSKSDVLLLVHCIIYDPCHLLRLK